MRRSTRSAVFVGFAAALFCCSDVQAQISARVLLRVLMLQTTNGQGTGFTVDVDRRQYLITAKHLVKGMGSESMIGIAKFNAETKIVWVPYKMKIFNCADPADIAVLVPGAQLTVDFPLEPSDRVTLGQDAYFFGFPFGMYSLGKNDSDLGYPIGLVKKGLLSGFKNEGDVDLIYLDGYNVFGFSGSPVVYRDTDQLFKVVGVVSGFAGDYGQVLSRRSIREQEITPEDRERGRIIEEGGHLYRLEEKMPNERVILNTGIVRSYAITPAIDLIHQHPIGPKVEDNFKPSPAQQ